MATIDSSGVAAPAPGAERPKSGGWDPAFLELKRRFPTTADMRAEAKRKLPRFAFEFGDGGAGGQDVAIARNNAAFDAIELVPRYGRLVAPPPVQCEILGRPYSAPIGVAPIGGPGTVYPGAERILGEACQKAGVPYVLGLVSGMTVEEAAQIAPDVLWFQLFRFARNDHAIGFDLVKRAQDAGVHTLVLTIDTPIRTTRPREVRSGITTPFKMTMGLRREALSSPRWTRALIRNGIPRFVNLRPYMESVDAAAAGKFMQREAGGAFTWEEIARYREKWDGPLVVKGLLHSDDAERAVSLGLDGIIVSNHGARQIEALPAPIDTLPAIAQRVGDSTTVLYDSGIRSGADVARAIALGADGTFAGKPFLWSLGALAQRGPEHCIKLLVEELRATLGQLGTPTLSDLRAVPVRHPGAYGPEELAARG